MTHDYYFRAADAAEFDAALGAAGIKEGDGIALDRIGEIVKIKGVDENDEPIVRIIEGYHVNMRTAEPLNNEQAEALADMMVARPAVPFRVWS